MTQEFDTKVTAQAWGLYGANKKQLKISKNCQSQGIL